MGRRSEAASDTNCSTSMNQLGGVGGHDRDESDTNSNPSRTTNVVQNSLYPKSNQINKKEKDTFNGYYSTVNCVNENIRSDSQLPHRKMNTVTTNL